jgi:hypothetical protein
LGLEVNEGVCHKGDTPTYESDSESQIYGNMSFLGKCFDKLLKDRVIIDSLNSYFGIKYENKLTQSCYQFGELGYRPTIEEFTNYFLWTKIITYTYVLYRKNNPKKLRSK